MAEKWDQGSMTERLAAALEELLDPSVKVDGGMEGLRPEAGHPIVVVNMQRVTPGPVMRSRTASWKVIGATAKTIGLAAEGEVERHWNDVLDALDAIPWALWADGSDRILYTPNPEDDAGFLGFSVLVTVAVRPTEDDPT